MITSELFLALFIIVLIMFIRQRMKQPAVKRTSQIPGPKPANDLEGNLDEIRSCESLHKFLERYHKQHGPIIAFWFGPTMCISISSRKLFQEHALCFDRPRVLFEGDIPMFGEDGMQLANGENGRRRHSAYSKSLNQTSIKKFCMVFNKSGLKSGNITNHEQIMSDEFQFRTQLGKDLVEKWLSYPEDKSLLLQDEMSNLAIKSILEALCGEELENNELVMNVKGAYDFCWSEIEKYMMGDIPQPESPRDVQFKCIKKTLDDLIRGILSNRRQLFRSEEDRLPIDAVLELHLPESTAISDMLTLFIAGFHTTGLRLYFSPCSKTSVLDFAENYCKFNFKLQRKEVLTWCIYFLATNEEVQNKVREELVNVLGTSNEMTAEMASRMKYLNQVLKETLRVSRIGTFAARVHHSDVILGGYRIPAETPVVHALGLSLHDEEVFPDPLRFDPDRFSPENEPLLPPFSFEPFGFSGKRKCPGYNFTYAEATVFLSLIIRSFKIELAYDQVVEPKFGFVTKMKDDLWVIAKPV